MSERNQNKGILVCDSDNVSLNNTLKCLHYIWSGHIEESTTLLRAQEVLSDPKQTIDIFIVALAEFVHIDLASWLLGTGFKGHLVLIKNEDDTLPSFIPSEQLTTLQRPVKLTDFTKTCAIESSNRSDKKLDASFLSELLNRRDALSIEFQPQYLARSEKLWGFECLTRFQHNGAKFDTKEVIDALEKHGFMDKFSQVFFKRLTEVLPAFMRTRLSLNLSLYNIEKYDLLTVIKKMLSDTNISADKITLEFDASAYFSSSAQAITLLCELKALGFDMAIDGYEGDISNLKGLPLMIDEVKLSVSHTRKTAGGFVLPEMESIIPLSKNIGTRIVFAEIEQYQQYKRAQKMSSEAILQGYYLAPPVGLSEVAELQLH